MLIQPSCGSRMVMFCGDVLRLRVEVDAYSVFCRCTWSAQPAGHKILWQDLPYSKRGRVWELNLPLLNPGSFECKPYVQTERGELIWPAGENIFVKTQPPSWRLNNGIYSVFLRQYGVPEPPLEDENKLNEAGYTILPPSGSFSDLIDDLDRIKSMGFNTIMLLPIFPVPYNYARMGRYGSPYASLDYFSVAAEYAEFNRYKSPNEQFIDLLDTVHHYNMRLILDIPANHTGWNSVLHNLCPEYFLRETDRSYSSPGAWGTVWKDLIRLDTEQKRVRDYLQKAFLYWLEMGVDGFRLDAGYMLPFAFWQELSVYIRRSYPETLLLLEGLGGDPCLTRKILEIGGVNWAYSELFQNYTPKEITSYLPCYQELSCHSGELFNFAETHDNNRLATVSKDYARFRCMLNALLSYNGCFGITNGVEYYVTRKIDVHQRYALAAEPQDENMMSLLSRLNQILQEHSSFYTLEEQHFLPSDNEQVIIVARGKAEKRLLLLFNPSKEIQKVSLQKIASGKTLYDLLSSQPTKVFHTPPKDIVELPAYSAFCLSTQLNPEQPLLNQRWRQLLLHILQQQGEQDWSEERVNRLTECLSANPHFYLANSTGEPASFLYVNLDVIKKIQIDSSKEDFIFDEKVLLLPPSQYMLLSCQFNFQVKIKNANGETLWSNLALAHSEQNRFSVILHPQWYAQLGSIWTIKIKIYTPQGTSHLSYRVFSNSNHEQRVSLSLKNPREQQYGLMSNQQGSYTLVAARFGEKYSKYDGWLAYNPAIDYPSDRLLLFSHLRVWIKWKDYNYQLTAYNQLDFRCSADNRLWWRFKQQLNRHYTVIIELLAQLNEHDNLLQISFKRCDHNNDFTLPENEKLTLIARPFLETRNFHSEGDGSFQARCSALQHGFSMRIQTHEFQFFWQNAFWKTAAETLDSGKLPMDEERGMFGRCKLFSPGYFQKELSSDEKSHLLLSNHSLEPENNNPLWHVPPASADVEETLRLALTRFIVRRGKHWTVLAGFPWFLDWGRDTFIVLRGLIAAGLYTQACDIILCFASYEHQGTLPNIICGDKVGNYETADAPLWFVLVCSELLEHIPELLSYSCQGRTLAQILTSIIEHYQKGCPNGVHMEKESALIYSPVHYTWMDTNYPSGTPRAGYPIEIQALWFSALNFSQSYLEPKTELLVRLKQSFEEHYWLKEKAFFSDCLHSQTGKSINEATADDALRPNQLLALTLGLVHKREQALSALTACRELLVPGAIRSLANRQVSYPLVIHHENKLLNDPYYPYWPQYLGNEDYRRKPAYHNGSAWGWQMPLFYEAWGELGGDKEEALSMLLSSLLLEEQAIPGFLPEVRDGNFPHHWRGCPAQAWSVSETLRVYLKLKS